MEGSQWKIGSNEVEGRFHAGVLSEKSFRRRHEKSFLSEKSSNDESFRRRHGDAELCKPGHAGLI